jgi:hypothetical protein
VPKIVRSSSQLAVFAGATEIAAPFLGLLSAMTESFRVGCSGADFLLRGSQFMSTLDEGRSVAARIGRWHQHER